MRNKCGFTIIEILILATFASLFFVLFLIQKTNLDAFSRDETRKTAINAIYYSLENDFYQTNGYYPSEINAEILPTVTSELWVDPSGYEFNAPESDYSYEPASCDYNNHCKEYILKSTLEKEATYIRTNKTTTQDD